ncbi:MAG: hypothetical protein H7Z73_04855 [Candidatus Saccharibacteria bacterium]|nr:hypothetical protein [Moraxellaceae bacterium]
MLSKLYLKDLSNLSFPFIQHTDKFIFIKQLLAVLFISFLIVTTGHATQWRDELPNAKILGSVDFNFFGFKIYNAKLWSETSPLDMTKPFALDLTYNHRVSRKLLVKIVIYEIKRLNTAEIPTSKIQDWQVKLMIAFPDVSQDDELIGVFLPSQGFRTYNKRGLIADIRDIELARYFFAVWLDENAKGNILRSKLLGLTP